MDSAVQWTDIAIVGFTLGLFAVAALQFAALRQSQEHNLTVQRAYVDMSHKSPPGLTLNLDGPEPRATVTMVIKNHGATPATVTRVQLGAWIGNQDLPDEPSYPDPASVRLAGEAVLMPGESFTTRFSLTMSSDQRDELLQHTQHLTLIGHVDYRDRFNRAHRSGYARRYTENPLDPGNNLVFELKEGCNYDKPLDTGPSWAA